MSCQPTQRSGMVAPCCCCCFLLLRKMRRGRLGADRAHFLKTSHSSPSISTITAVSTEGCRSTSRSVAPSPPPPMNTFFGFGWAHIAGCEPEAIHRSVERRASELREAADRAHVAPAAAGRAHLHQRLVVDVLVIFCRVEHTCAARPTVLSAPRAGSSPKLRARALLRSRGGAAHVPSSIKTWPKASVSRTSTYKQPAISRHHCDVAAVAAHLLPLGLPAEDDTPERHAVHFAVALRARAVSRHQRRWAGGLLRTWQLLAEKRTKSSWYHFPAMLASAIAGRLAGCSPAAQPHS